MTTKAFYIESAMTKERYMREFYDKEGVRPPTQHQWVGKRSMTTQIIHGEVLASGPRD